MAVSRCLGGPRLGVACPIDVRPDACFLVADNRSQVLIRAGMTKEYLLPCSCGETHRVNPRQSGETLVCGCGARLNVPTRRELQTLEPAPPTAAPLQPTWGRRQGLIFLGLLITTVSLAVCGYLYFVEMPATP